MSLTFRGLLNKVHKYQKFYDVVFQLAALCNVTTLFWLFYAVALQKSIGFAIIKSKHLVNKEFRCTYREFLI
jgi:hypothetical protein